MNKTMLSTCFLLVAGSAVAADGTIHFTGSITDQTCTVDSGTQSLNVDLGKVSQASLDGAAGMKAAPTRFSLSVSDCPDTVTGANVKFDGTSDGVNQNLLALDSGTGIATGVGIEIADKNGTPIPLHSASADYTLAAGTNSLDFVARYVSTGTAVTTGTANGTSQFTINYK
ncbi:fimbrial protein [Salmonella enterica]|uniref:Fimbrial protein n=1 Tax=Salmonella enterica TaxID=28901 RepID=A0A5Y7W6I3_SALER|nr:type 1 fimbrial protein [Salmonella enterica]EAV6589560.1 type 1 fimbrial protein [Salmonella enterica subsp. arizonae serovar 63:z4,z23:-]EBD1259799.1 type 1 fimbrial protein [Salmonella enterica subsp. arizonae serovar 62:z4,z32:-]EDW1853846.1 fimbrial protein [Salmonella enterica subsp. diarizonae]EJU7776778.1 fimbrial protein [Salmonella enterica subsp. arizonae serovar 6,7:g,z51:-]VEA46384.1 Fimbrial protein [Salmonella enterica subsp. arizonae]